MKRYAVLVLVLCSLGGTAAAYTRITLNAPAGQSPRWPSMPVPYWINDQGLRQIANGSEFQAIHDSFLAWQNVETADIRFEYKGTTSTSTLGFDGLNLISFADATAPLGSSTVAATFSFFSSAGSSTINTEADIIFNSAFEFSTSGENNRFDIQSVATHEIGHFIGLDHSGLISSVMVPFVARTQIDQRTLSYDDIAGVSEIYPRASAPPVAQIRGRIMAGAAPVFGAHVVAVAEDGTPLLSGISQRDGVFMIRPLPAGVYRLYAEPLDGPVTSQNLGGYYSPVSTDFGTTYFGNTGNWSDAAPIAVVAGGVVTGADVQVLPKNTVEPVNLTRPSLAPRVPRSAQGTFCIGGENVGPGLAITTSTPAILLGPAVFGSQCSTAPGSIAVPFTISAAAPLGPKNIAVNRGNEAAVVSGTLVVIDPRPAAIQVNPPIGAIDGGTLVTISGSNFRAGARVTFGGLPASNIQTVDSGTILATTPRNSPGTMNVLVINPDGVAGLAQQAFTYSAPSPVITGLIPESGPPATSVLITGEQFGARTQNLEVRFNGIPARIVASTATTIQTLVPYGAQSGAVTVRVFDQSVEGPVFRITEPPISSNVAAAVYRFVDATAESGGTDLVFAENDDAIAWVDLPFTFSLFRDIYVSGSRISISTNGWMSLETLPMSRQTSAFQNFPLGSPQSPPALIAPFWDDLTFEGAVSKVSVRVLGSAPNRQLVVQWTRMSILDDAGLDLNAALTFEIILFEGSNDIQVLYQTLTGPRSDGAGATVGIQDLLKTNFKEVAFNRPILQAGLFTTHRFAAGLYTTTTMMPDTTPPSTPVVTDAGPLTSSTTTLPVSWTSSDPESGIREFQYAIGGMPGATDIRAYTSTAQNSVLATGLSLQPGSTYYVSVRAVNNAGLTSEPGISDGIRVDSQYQTFFKVVPWIAQNTSSFTGIAMLANGETFVVLKALDASGGLVTGPGTNNPAIVHLAAGRQDARVVPEIFGLQSFDGWIELESSASDLAVYAATGSRNMTELDGNVARNLSSDFVFFHAGANAVFVNPSSRTANVAVTGFGTASIQSFQVPARSRVTRAVTRIEQFRSSEPLAAVELVTSPGKLDIGSPHFAEEAQAVLVFPHAVIGVGYRSMVTVANPTSDSRNVTLSFAGAARTVRIDAGAGMRVPLAEFFALPVNELRAGALRVSSSPVAGAETGTLMGVLDIENDEALTSIAARPPSTSAVFPHVAHGNGLFTGLAFAAGDRPTAVTIDVYAAAGGTPRSATFALSPNQHLGRLISELVPAVTSQTGGYIRVHSDEPIWTWEIIGSAQTMAAVPPL